MISLGHGWRTHEPRVVAAGGLACWPEGERLPVRRRRLGRRVAWCLALTAWFLAVMALGGRSSPYTAPVSAPAASAPAAPHVR